MAISATVNLTKLVINLATYINTTVPFQFQSPDGSPFQILDLNLNIYNDTNISSEHLYYFIQLAKVALMPKLIYSTVRPG